MKEVIKEVVVEKEVVVQMVKEVPSGGPSAEDLEDANRRAESYRKELDCLRDNFKATLAESEALKAELKARTETKQSVDDLVAEMKVLSDSIQKLEAENKDLRVKVGAFKKDSERWRVSSAVGGLALPGFESLQLEKEDLELDVQEERLKNRPPVAKVVKGEWVSK